MQFTSASDALARDLPLQPQAGVARLQLITYFGAFLSSPVSLSRCVADNFTKPQGRPAGDDVAFLPASLHSLQKSSSLPSHWSETLT